MTHMPGIAPAGKQFVSHPPEVIARIERLCEFHQQTKTSLPAGSTARAEQRPNFYRVFENTPKIPLPTKLLDAPTGVMKIMSLGINALPDSMTSPPQNLQTLASWLYLAAGITGRIEINRNVHHLRAYPSAGALYPTEIYVLALGISDLEPGLYHYCPKEFSLHKLREGWVALSQLKRGRPDLEPLKTMPAVLLVSSLFWRSAWKYGDRAYRYAAMDAGHVVENLVQCATGLGIQTVTRLHLNERNTRELIGCRNEDTFDNCEAVQAMVAWSDKALKPIEPPAQRLPTGNLEPIRRTPLSSSCTEYPALKAAHEACSAPGVGLHEIRSPYTEVAPIPEGSELLQVGTEDIYNDMGLMQATRRRRSTREFTDHPVTADQFAKLNRVSFRSPTYYPVMPKEDHLGLVRAYWFVHKVIGITPGLWYYHTQYDKYTALRYGDFRFDTKYLCNDQEFVANGSALCLITANLRELMMVSSPDSYRLAHLEAGIAVERMYLACTAMNIECCSVGSFQDDEIRKSLDLFQTGWECLYAFAIGGVRRPKQQEAVAPQEAKGLQLR